MDVLIRDLEEISEEYENQILFMKKITLALRGNHEYVDMLK